MNEKKSITLQAWQNLDPALYKEIYDLYYKFYMLADSEELKEALAISRCLLMEMESD